MKSKRRVAMVAATCRRCCSVRKGTVEPSSTSATSRRARSSAWPSSFMPDATTLATGNAGARFACGVVAARGH